MAKLRIARLEHELGIADLTGSGWENAQPHLIDRYWNDEIAPVGRRLEVRLLWSMAAFYVRFDANQDGPLVISDEPNLTQKAFGLWERDVCEIFIAPDRNGPCKYFEFEVAPTGEWLDLAVDMTGSERIANFGYESGMQAAALIEESRVLMAVRIPWEAFDTKPKAGNVWLGNIFRCVGSGPNRGYLAWRPTMTEKPNFHVPSVFGKFEFR